MAISLIICHLLQPRLPPIFLLHGLPTFFPIIFLIGKLIFWLLLCSALLQLPFSSWVNGPWNAGFCQVSQNPRSPLGDTGNFSLLANITAAPCNGYFVKKPNYFCGIQLNGPSFS